MDLIMQQSINAISLGGVYAMLVLGMTIEFSIVGLINFAHGDIMTFDGYSIFCRWLLAYRRWPPLQWASPRRRCWR